MQTFNARKRHWSLLGILLTGVCCLATSLPGAEESRIVLQDYRIMLNGRILQVAPVGLMDADEKMGTDQTRLAVVNGIPLVLGVGKIFRFRTAETDNGRLYHSGNDGGLNMVGAKVGEGYIQGKIAPINPLAKLAPEQVKALWGIVLDRWEDGLLETLKHFGAEATCLTVTDNVVTGDPKRIPYLPSDVKFLNFIANGEDGFSDISILRSLRDLVQFSYVSYRNPEFDVELIAANKELRFLDLSGTRVRNVAALGKLKNLRYLNISFCKELSDFSFVRDLPLLSEIEMYRTEIEDLSPMADHPALRSVKASQGNVKTLPQRAPPHLKVLEILQSAVTKEHAQDFQKANPNAGLVYDLNRIFQRQISSTTRIRVRMGTAIYGKTQEAVVFEKDAPLDVAEVIGQIEIDEKKPGLNCPCSSGPFVEFFKGEELLATVAYRHGQQVEWMAGWIGNWNIGSGSVVFLSEWLKKNGAIVPPAPPAPPAVKDVP